MKIGIDTSTKMNSILSIIAIILSVFSFVSSHWIDKRRYGPDFRLAAFSIPKGIEIQLENVGPRIQKVISITYILSDAADEQCIVQWTDNLSSVFYQIPCLTRAESRMKDEMLLPDSKHKLLKTTFEQQEQLMEAWEIVGRLTVKVEYKGLFMKRTLVRPLKNAYTTFLDAIKDENGNVRTLLAYREENMEGTINENRN